MFSERIDFSHEPNLTIDELVRRVLASNPEGDAELLKKCYEFAELKHIKQKRSSGEAYIIHPLNVAATLVKLKMDLDSIMAGLLHDTVEDCDVSPEDIEKEFGKSVAQIVVGCTKISKIKFKSKEESQAENFRKMVVAMAQDLRVIIVKLSDRMHNMRTLQYVSKEKQMAKAQETLDIYVPLASRLGINSVKGELEDLCLRYLHPDTYYRLAEKISMKRTERDGYIRDTIDTVQEKLMEYSVQAEVTGRPKHFYSIYKKMSQRGVDFDQIQDLLAFRILTNNITECYKVLGVIHSAFTPVPGRFKDYIAIPKVNNYQSLHTTVIGPGAERIEIQIRTFEMHEVAERGVAAHWKYKERDKTAPVNKLKWVEELMEFNQNVTSSSEFMDVVKNDLDVGGIFIFTPAGDVKELRYGATALDFAYSVHTQVGNQCVGAKVNGKMVPLKYRLKSGDTVEVLTSKTQVPSKDWLKICKTSRAITKIKQYLQKVERDKHHEDGEQMLDQALKRYGTTAKNIEKQGGFHNVYDSFHIKTLEELQVNIGSRMHNLRDILPKVMGIDYVEVPQEEVVKESYADQIVKNARRSLGRDNAVIVDGLDDVQVRMGRCCNPIPGDPIIGFITRGRGITVHAVGCHRAHEVENSRRIDVQWNKGYAFAHPVNIRVMTHDKPGILSKISKTITNGGINIRAAMARSLPDQKGSFVFEIEVKNYSELLKTISAIEQMEEVITVSRA
ncbi:MAG: bifunctional (p)ppGpp synthetase/guanosine-3',5'-bis(diphosphate) 3'-pyrophosphohydrolase [Bacteriovoracaceae bacterium]|nr:bifunctional (p)ppGpp synthetase/guanosine-3',5'-bis(diphosphate) 3'-pyrophosphohydrolase [Bacteriovoracaceae bacterium]